jgi:hypothetical protein
MLFFKYQIKVSAKLKKFIYDCDRLDDVWFRKTLYNAIKNN